MRGGLVSSLHVTKALCAASAAQSLADRSSNKLMNKLIVRKTHFSLRRMDVDIYSFWIDIEEQHEPWMATPGKK
jgi:hypothetical protein